jgi:formylglycine-generating enzyme required for sulfatase activity
MGKYEVTQAQWQAVMGSNPSRFKDIPDNPVEQVSWDDIQPFLAKLNLVSSDDILRFQMPTESQWEHACRAGSKARFSFEGSADQHAWYSLNSNRMPHKVGQLGPNQFGLNDMHGNVWEWCSDWYGDHEKRHCFDPVGLAFGSGRVRRGGCMESHIEDCASAIRGSSKTSHVSYGFGFRLAMNLNTSAP